MQRFLDRYSADIQGTLSGFDRLLLRGTFRGLMHIGGVLGFLNLVSVRLKDFASFAERATAQLKQKTLAFAETLGRPVQEAYRIEGSKEQYAQQITTRDSIEEGLVCIIKAVEPCRSIRFSTNEETGKPEMNYERRKCQFLYHYLVHPEFGLMFARVQTWFPYEIQYYINGREWLSRRLDKAGMPYQRYDNCFLSLGDIERAQKEMEQFLELPFIDLLTELARQVNPLYRDMLSPTGNDYYWSIIQSEWATDIMFNNVESLNAIYATLVRGGMLAFDCENILRFFNKRHLSHEARSDYRSIVEGIRLKHWYQDNSQKLYNKHSVLRPENTINNPRAFNVFRPKENDPNGPCDLRYLRKSVVDIKRRSEISQKCNEKYLDALAELDTTVPLKELIEPVTRRTRYKKKYVRGLRPWTQDDRALLQAVNNGDFKATGFRNRDLFPILYPNADPNDRKRLSSAITRKIRLLRAHRLIRKMPRSHRYRVTDDGNRILNAILMTQNVSLNQLQKAAA